MGITTAGNKLDILNAVPNKVTEKSSSKVPVVGITSALEAKLKEIAALKEALKDAEGHKTLLEAEIMPQVERLRRDLSIKEQKHMTSISLAGVSTYICQNKYSAIPLSEEERLRSAFKDSFEIYFQRKVVITVDVEKISAEALTLLVRDGAAMKTETLKPTESLHFARSTDSQIGNLSDSIGLRPVSFLKF